MKKTEEKKETKKTTRRSTKKEELVEVVIPADIDVVETDILKQVKQAKKAQTSKKTVELTKVEKPQEKAEKASTSKPKSESKPKAVKVTIPTQPSKVINQPIGNYSDDIAMQNRKSEKTVEDLKYDLFRVLNTGANSKQLFYGTVYGIEPDKDWGACVLVLFNNQRIRIPINQYFEDNFIFGKRFEIQTPEEQLKRKITFAGFQVNAHVAFIPFLVEWKTRENSYGYEEKYINCVASRKEAMKLLRDINFLHQNRKYSVDNAKTIQQGDIEFANVIAVKEDYILVEACGVETRILARDASEDFIENCKDYFSPGDRIRVRVRRVYFNKNNKTGEIEIYLRLTGRTRDITDETENIKVGDRYFGTVDKVNPKKQTYTIHLKTGVIVGVSFQDVQGGVPLYVGNRVNVLIDKIKDNGFIYGKATKI